MRVVFLGGEWSAGRWANPEDSPAGRFQHYLEKFLSQKIDLRSIPVRDVSEIPELTRQALSQKPADYVFYFCDHSRVPLELASRYYAPWKSDGDHFLDYLGRQIGAIRLGNKISSSAYPENILLDPLSGVLRQMSQTATFFGAKFILLWPGFTIGPLSWDMQAPEGWTYKALSYLDLLKSKPRVSSERLNYYLRTQSIPHIANLQLTNFFAAIREMPDAGSVMSSKSTSDKVGEMLATSVISQEF